MIGTATNKAKKKVDIYLDENFKVKATSGLSGNTIWNFKVLGKVTGGYHVEVLNSNSGQKGSNIFSPTKFYIKTEGLSVKLNAVENGGNGVVGLQTGDIMEVSDKNGKKLGYWKFTKY